MKKLIVLICLLITSVYSQTLVVDSVFESTCADGRVYLSVVGGAVPYQFQLTSGPSSYSANFPTILQASGSFLNLPSGNYTAQVIDNVNDTAVVSFLVGSANSPITLPNVGSVNRDCRPYFLSQSCSLGSIGFYVWNNSINGSPSSINGGSFVQASVPGGTALGSPMSDYMDTSYNSFGAIGGVPPYNYSITGLSNGFVSGPSLNPKFNNVPRGGRYEVKIEDACGSQKIFIINTDPLPMRRNFDRIVSECGLSADIGTFWDPVLAIRHQANRDSLESYDSTYNTQTLDILKPAGVGPYELEIVSGAGTFNKLFDNDMDWIGAFETGNPILFPDVDVSDVYILKLSDACGQILYDTLYPSVVLDTISSGGSFSLIGQTCKDGKQTVLFPKDGSGYETSEAYVKDLATDIIVKCTFTSTGGGSFTFEGTVGNQYELLRYGLCSGVVRRDTFDFVEEGYTDLTADIVTSCNGLSSVVLSTSFINPGVPVVSSFGSTRVLFAGAFDPAKTYIYGNSIWGRFSPVSDITNRNFTVNNLSPGYYTFFYSPTHWGNNPATVVDPCNYITFYIPPYLSPEIDEITFDPVCPSNTGGNIYVSSKSGTAPFQYRIRTSNVGSGAGPWSVWQDSTTFVNMPDSTYDIEIQDFCLSSDTQSITTGALSIPTLVTKPILCLGSELLITAEPNLILSGASYSWTKDLVPLPYTSTEISILNAQLSDSGDYAVTVSFPGCPNQISSTTIKIVSSSNNVLASALPMPSCEGDVVRLTATNPGFSTVIGGKWSVYKQPSYATIAPDFENDILNSTDVYSLYSTDGPPQEPWVFKWESYNGVCWSNDTVSIKVFELPLNVNAGANQKLCEATTTVLNADSVSSDLYHARGAWSQISGPAGLTFVDTTDAKTTINGLVFTNPSSEYVLRWTVYNDSVDETCDNFEEITITNYEQPLVPTAGLDSTLCGSLFYTMQASAPSAGEGIWFVIDRPLNVLIPTFSDPSSESTDVTFNGGGVYTFVWSVSNGVCQAYSDTVVITVLFSDAGFDRAECLSTISGGVQLKADSIEGFPGTWSKVIGSDVLTFNPNSISGSDLALATGFTQADTSILAWTITDGISCTVKDSIRIIVRAEPTVADAGPDQLRLCASFINLNANIPTEGIGGWSQISGPTTGVFSDFTNPSSTVNSLAFGTYEFVWTIENNPCSSSKDTVLINVGPIPTVSIVSSQIANCSDLSAGYIVAQGVGGGGNYEYALSALGPWFSSDTLIGLSSGTYEVYVRDSNVLSCLSNASSQVTLVDPICLGKITKDDSIGTIEDLDVLINPLVNDTLGNGVGVDTSTLMVISGPNNGTAIVDTMLGTITYDPDTNFNGYDTIEYVLCNTAQVVACDTSFVFVTITPENDQPIAIADSITISEDIIALIDPLINDNDSADNIVLDSTSVSVIGGPNYGIAAINSVTGVVTYTPNANFVGFDTITYVVCDNGIPLPSKCDTAVIFITINPINDAPITVDDSVITLEDVNVSIDPLMNDNDTLDGIALDSSSVMVIGGPSNGVTSVDPITGVITYDPDTNFNGIDTIFYSVCDSGLPLPAKCDTAAIYITVNPLNDAPTAKNDFVLTSENSNTLVDPLVNDNDSIDGIELDSTSVSVIGGPNNGAASVNPITGVITYTPITNYVGFDTITYVVCDSGIPLPSLCDTATIYVTITAINDAPVVNNDSVITLEDVNVSIDPLMNDNDTLDGIALDSSSVMVIGGPSNGVTSVDPITGVITYDPDTNFNGIDTIFYSVCDSGLPLPAKCDTAAIYITVNPLNDAPTAKNDFVLTSENSNTLIDPLVNDNDSIDGIELDSTSVSVIGGPNNGAASVNTVTGVITYIPITNFVGSDTITYAVCDSGVPLPSLCDTATIYITVTAINDAPVVNNDSVITLEDVNVFIDPLMNDNDTLDGIALDSSSVMVIGGPSNGITSVDPITGVITYDPDTNFNGIDTILYSVCDSGFPLPIKCDTASILITVNPVNDVPVINDDVAITSENVSVLIDPLVNDNDNEDGIALDSTSVNVIVAPSNGSTVVNAVTGEITYDPNANFSGIDTITYAICDSGFPLPVICDTAIIIITVSSVNHPPVVNNDSSGTLEEINVSIDPLINDNDSLNGIALDSASVIVVGGPSNGTASVDPITGVITYDPDTNFNGIDTIIYSVCDSGLPLPVKCDTAAIYITVTPVNDGPFINNDFINSVEDINFLIDPLVNDNDSIDGIALDSSSFTVISGPSNGVASVNPVTGFVTYDPDTNFNGIDTITYSVCDSGLALPVICDTAIIIITVNPANDAPIANNDSVNSVEDMNVTIDPLINDNDSVDGIALDSSSIIIITGPNNGTTQIDPNTGIITYNPDSNFIGLDFITYSICDSGVPLPVKCDTATIVVRVGITITDTISVVLKTNDNFIACDTLLNGINANNVIICGGGLNGTSTISGTCITYTPNIGYNGFDTACYVVCNDGVCDTTIITIIIDPLPKVYCNDTIVYLSSLATYLIDSSYVIDSVIDNNIDTVWLSNYDFDCSDLGVNQVTVYVRDSLGQLDSCVAQVTVADTISPVVSCQDLTLNLDSNGLASIIAEDIDNGSTDNCSIDNLSVDISSFDCSNLGLNIVTLTVTDNSGNITTCQSNVTVVNNIAPSLTCPDNKNEIVEVVCKFEIPDYSSEYIALGGCYADSSVTYNQSPLAGTIVNGDDHTEVVTMTITDQSGNVSICSFNVNVVCKKKVTVPRGFSPNGDAVNDFLEMPGIEAFPNNRLKIFNRWGNKVFEKEGYLGDWNGTNSVGLSFGGDNLPIGTYFYVLDLGEPDVENIETLKGYIYISR